MEQYKLFQGDNMISLKKLPDNSIDSIVSDPPYGLSFMGKKWDYDIPSVEFWKEVYRVLKPGGHVLSFGGTRTYHRMAVNIEDAGFEIRDQIMWIYGSGFPKSHNIGKAVDKIQGNEREVVGIKENWHELKGTADRFYVDKRVDLELTKGTSPQEGWGTALKPANEPICVARKPLSEKTIADNVLKWGTGGINIDGCRIGTSDKLQRLVHQEGCSDRTLYVPEKRQNGKKIEHIDAGEGRFPANIIFDESAGEMLDEQSGISKPKKERTGRKGGSPIHQSKLSVDVEGHWPGDNGGGASRYFFNVNGIGGTEDFFIYKENNIIVWNMKSLGINDSLEVDGIVQLEKMVKENINQKPELYGSNTMVKYLTNTISITKMKTHSIMNFPIWSASTKMNIGSFTLMIDEKTSPLLTEKNILNVQIVSKENALVSFINPQKEVLVPIVSYALEESLVSGGTIIESTITNTTENIGINRVQYIPKVSKSERNMGLDGFEDKEFKGRDELANGHQDEPFKKRPGSMKNTHPTLKPVQLMAYLCRLVTPPNGIVLDPFMGSGSTGISALLEGFRFCGMEMSEEYFKIAEARIEAYELYRPFVEKKTKKK